MTRQWRAIRFIDQPIDVEFDRQPTLSKKPSVPDRFTWDCEDFHISELEQTWFDYGRRGRMARNMSPAHQEVAFRRGSWGVGRFYFRVLTEEGRAFDLYYDRAPREAADREGVWMLFRELTLEKDQPSS
jgi:hypothetical protein